MLSALHEDGIKRGMTLKEIYATLGITVGNGEITSESSTAQTRISSLLHQNWLCKKIIKHRKANDTHDEIKFIGREKYIYFLGGKSRLYLSKFSTFDEGWLCRIPERYKLRELLSEKEKLELEKESKKFIDISNGTNTHTNEKEIEIREGTDIDCGSSRRESW